MPNIDYPINYKEACFYAWYNAGKPHFNSILRVIPAMDDGSKPTIETVRKWKNGGDGWENWDEHAARLDEDLRIRLDKDAIDRRAKLVKQLAADGAKLKEIGLEYLKKDDPFKDNPAAAVRAITAGIEIEWKYTGMSEQLLAISSMSPKQLEKEALRLMGKDKNDVIEAQLEDLPTDEEEDDDNP